MKGRSKPLCFIALLSTLSVLFFVFPAFASGTEGHGSYWKDYIFQIVNFAILIAILVKFIRPPLKGYLERRHNQVREGLQKAKELSEAAENAYNEVQQRLDSIDAEIDAIREQMLNEVELEKKRLMEEAEKRAEIMRAQAEKGLKDEIAQIKKRLKREISLEALTLAERLVKKSLNNEDQRRLIDTFIQKLGSRN